MARINRGLTGWKSQFWTVIKCKVLSGRYPLPYNTYVDCKEKDFTENWECLRLMPVLNGFRSLHWIIEENGV